MTNQKAQRVYVVDFLRGTIMIIMALDHVRDFFTNAGDPLNLQTTTPQLFFTRWITHFCAPTFLFLSGISVYLSTRQKSRDQVCAFLIKRGFWLVFVDFFIMSFALTFNPHYNTILLTVLWAIGCSMIILGLLIRFAPKIILPVGLVIFLGHDLISIINPPGMGGGGGSVISKILFTGIYFTQPLPGHTIGFLYAILPWCAVMLLGYWFAKYLDNKKVILTAALSLLVLFFALRIINLYGDPAPYEHQKNALYNLLSFINTTKYPPSLQFLCMTLGPCLLLLLVSLKSNMAFPKFAAVYGRVPFFYFVIHFFLAHVLLAAAFFITGHTAAEISGPDTTFYFHPAGFGFGLPVVYGVWLLVVLTLYFPCKWFYNYKLRNSQWWLRYL